MYLLESIFMCMVVDIWKRQLSRLRSNVKWWGIRVVPATPMRCAPRTMLSRWMIDIAKLPVLSKSGSTFHIPVSAHGVVPMVDYQETNVHGKWLLLWRMEKKWHTRATYSARKPGWLGSCWTKTQSCLAGPRRQESHQEKPKLKFLGNSSKFWEYHNIFAISGISRNLQHLQVPPYSPWKFLEIFTNHDRIPHDFLIFSGSFQDGTHCSVISNKTRYISDQINDIAVVVRRQVLYIEY